MKTLRTLDPIVNVYLLLAVASAFVVLGLATPEPATQREPGLLVLEFDQPSGHGESWALTFDHQAQIRRGFERMIALQDSDPTRIMQDARQMEPVIESFIEAANLEPQMRDALRDILGGLAGTPAVEWQPMVESRSE